MGRETHAEQRLIRQNILKCGRGIAGHYQSALYVANIKRTGQDPGQTQYAENSGEKERGKPFRIGV